MESENDIKYQLTPKGFLAMQLVHYGINFEEADDLWHKLEAFCLKRIQKENPDAEYAAVIFDGNGGEVIGLDKEGQDVF